jgi:hypothetical protein
VQNRFDETFTSREQRYSVGNDPKVGGRYLSISVGNGIIDYDEQYGISAEQFRLFSENATAAIEFVEGCRHREHDDQLIYQPSTNRGTPVRHQDVAGTTETRRCELKVADMAPNFVTDVRSIVEPLMTRLGFQADDFDDRVDEGGRYGSVVFYCSPDCKIQVYRSSREGQINVMIAALDAPNVFGAYDRSGNWQNFTMVVVRQGIPREQLMQENPTADFPTQTQSLEWVRRRIETYFPLAHTGILEGSAR